MFSIKIIICLAICPVNISNRKPSGVNTFQCILTCTLTIYSLIVDGHKHFISRIIIAERNISYSRDVMQLRFQKFFRIIFRCGIITFRIPALSDQINTDITSQSIILNYHFCIVKDIMTGRKFYPVCLRTSARNRKS